MVLLFFPDMSREHLRHRPQQGAPHLGQQWPVLWMGAVTLGAPRKGTPARHQEGPYLLALPWLRRNARDPRIRAERTQDTTTSPTAS